MVRCITIDHYEERKKGRNLRTDGTGVHLVDVRRPKALHVTAMPLAFFISSPKSAISLMLKVRKVFYVLYMTIRMLIINTQNKGTYL